MSTRPTAELILLGRRIREHREASGWSRDRLARASGLNATYLGRIERGCANPSFLALRRLGAAMDVPASRLVDDDLPRGTRMVRSYLPQDDYQALRALARCADASLNDIVVEAVRAHLRSDTAAGTCDADAARARATIRDTIRRMRAEEAGRERSP